MGRRRTRSCDRDAPRHGPPGARARLEAARPRLRPGLEGSRLMAQRDAAPRSARRQQRVVTPAHQRGQVVPRLARGVGRTPTARCPADLESQGADRSSQNMSTAGLPTAPCSGKLWQAARASERRNTRPESPPVGAASTVPRSPANLTRTTACLLPRRPVRGRSTRRVRVRPWCARRLRPRLRTHRPPEGPAPRRPPHRRRAPSTDHRHLLDKAPTTATRTRHSPVSTPTREATASRWPSKPNRQAPT